MKRIIICSKFSGFSAALYAAKADYEVPIFEINDTSSSLVRRFIVDNDYEFADMIFSL